MFYLYHFIDIIISRQLKYRKDNNKQNVFVLGEGFLPEDFFTQ
jgi:hypothetical protein